MAKRWTPPPLGTRYGTWTVLGRDPHRYSGGRTKLFVRCDCGNVTTRFRHNLIRAKGMGCELCVVRPPGNGRKPEDIQPGTKYGKWTIIEVLDPPAPKVPRRAVARCDCGNERQVQLSALKTGRSSSCRDCHHKAQLKQWTTDEPFNGSTWLIAEGNQPGAERINVTCSTCGAPASYSPAHVPSPCVACHPRRRVRPGGEHGDWLKVAEANGIKRSAYYMRVNKLGWDRERAATKPANLASQGIDRGGELLPDGRRAVDVAADNGISRKQYAMRRRNGWDPERAATEPVVPLPRSTIKPGDVAGHWTVTDRTASRLTVVHGPCGVERKAGTHQFNPELRCPTCRDEQRRQNKETAKRNAQQDKEAARAERLATQRSQHPIGATYNGWTITGYRGPHSKLVLVTARHHCGHQISTSASRISGKTPPRCVCALSRPAPTDPDLTPGARHGTFTVVRWRGYSPGGDRIDLVCDCGHRFAVLVDKLRAGLAECRQCAKRKAS